MCIRDRCLCPRLRLRALVCALPTVQDYMRDEAGATAPRASGGKSRRVATPMVLRTRPEASRGPVLRRPAGLRPS
eukprot:11731051-Alexandrium_andersonii.AAC.1